MKGVFPEGLNTVCADKINRGFICWFICYLVYLLSLIIKVLALGFQI